MSPLRYLQVKPLQGGNGPALAPYRVTGFVDQHFASGTARDIKFLEDGHTSINPHDTMQSRQTTRSLCPSELPPKKSIWSGSRLTVCLPVHLEGSGVEEMLAFWITSRREGRRERQ